MTSVAEDDDSVDDESLQDDSWQTQDWAQGIDQNQISAIREHAPVLQYFIGNPSRFKGDSQRALRRISIWVGLGGIAAMLVVLDCVVPILFQGPRPASGWGQVSALLVLITPAVVVFSVLMSCPAIWHESVWMRVIACAILTLISWLAYLFATMTINGTARVGYIDFVMCASITVSAVTTGVLLQLVSRKTLMPFSLCQAKPKQLGIQSLIILTTTIACLIAVAKQSPGNSSEVIAAFLLVALCVLFGSVVLLRFLGEEVTRKSVVGFVVFVFALFMALFGIAVVVVPNQSPLMAILASLIGTLSTTFPFALCLFWLRCCGWRCVR